MKTQILLVLFGAIILLAACKGKGSSAQDTADYEVLNNSKKSNASGADSTAREKLIKTADMRLKVKSVQQTAETISALTASYNGMVVHHQMGSVIERSQDIRISDDSVMRVSSFNSTADMTVRIPAARVEEFMNKVSHMGIYVINRRMDIEDRSLDYLSARLKLKSRAELVQQQKAGTVIIKKPEAVLNLKDDLVDQQISNVGIDDKVKNSTISLSFYQSNVINKEIIANDDPAAYDLSFFKRLGIALANGWYLFKELLLALANLWVLLVMGVVAWILIRNYVRAKPALIRKEGVGLPLNNG